MKFVRKMSRTRKKKEIQVGLLFILVQAQSPQVSSDQNKMCPSQPSRGAKLWFKGIYFAML